MSCTGLPHDRPSAGARAAGSPAADSEKARRGLARQFSRVGAFAGLLLGGLLLALVAPAWAWAAPSPAAAPPPPAATASTTPGGSAAPTSGESIVGTLRSGDNALAGIRVTVTPATGGPATEGLSDATGAFRVSVPKPGRYRVQLDTASLPKGVALAPGAPNPLTVVVAPDRPERVALFRLAGGAGSTANTPNQPVEWIQLLVDGLKFGLIIAMAAIGLSLIYGTTQLTNFAHGELVTFGALAAFFFNVEIGVQLIIATVFAVIAGGLAGSALELGLWRPLRRRGTGLIAALVVSIGLSLFLRYLFLYLYSGRTQPYNDYAVGTGIDIGPFNITARDLWTMGISVVVLAAVGVLLLRSRIGKAMRAVADNRALAAASGIDVERIILFVWVVGSALAALGGVFLGMSQQVTWDMGFQLLLLMFAGVTLGGLGTAFGALLGSIIVGVFISESTLVIPIELKNVGALVILIVILLVRPNGLLGRRERIG